MDRWQRCRRRRIAGQWATKIHPTDEPAWVWGRLTPPVSSRDNERTPEVVYRSTWTFRFDASEAVIPIRSSRTEVSRSKGELKILEGMDSIKASADVVGKLDVCTKVAQNGLSWVQRLGNFIPKKSGAAVPYVDEIARVDRNSVVGEKRRPTEETNGARIDKLAL